MLLLRDILRRHAAVRGDKIAYVVGSRRVSYAAFQRRSNQLARALQRLGVGRGDRVAVLAHNCADYPLLYFAAIKLGAIVVPVSARFAATEVSHVVGHAEAETFFVADDFADLVTQLRAAGGLASVRRFVGFDGADEGPGETSSAAPAPDNRSSADLRLATLADAEPADDVDTFVDECDPHVMLYTSGTTGSPKGTLLSQRAYYLQALTSHLQLGFEEDDIAVSMFPMFHMGGWALPLGFWHIGGTAVILRKPEPERILECIERERATYFYGVPTVYRALLAHPDFDRFDLGSLRLLGGGTAAMTAEQVRDIKARFRCPRMVILYGSTEAGPISVVRPADIDRKSETVGRPYLNVDVEVRDEAGLPVPVGDVGEVAVRSEFTMLGYWRNPEETARTLRDGWVVTGDLGTFDRDGFLSIVGRRKEVIRSGGESIYPVEVERVLLEHPLIREASVLGVADPHWGEAVAAAVVLEPGAQLSVAAVVEHVRGRLASYKKPRHVCFFEALPRTAASQQVHKSLLKEMVSARLAL